MAKPVNIYEAKTRLSELVERASRGEEIVIAKAGKPLARLVSIKAEKPKRTFGRWRGEIWIAPDFDDPLPDDLQRLFDGETEE